MDTVTVKKRSEIMRAVKGQDTVLEKNLRSLLHKEGLRFRKNVRTLPGKPDIVFVTAGLIVFIDSCFWHGCRRHLRMPNSNVGYWMSKIERNRNRDKIVNRKLREQGWKVMRIWEHQLKKDISSCVAEIKKQLTKLIKLNHPA